MKLLPKTQYIHISETSATGGISNFTISVHMSEPQHPFWDPSSPTICSYEDGALVRTTKTYACPLGGLTGQFLLIQRGHIGTQSPLTLCEVAINGALEEGDTGKRVVSRDIVAICQFYFVTTNLFFLQFSCDLCL